MTVLITWTQLLGSANTDSLTALITSSDGAIGAIYVSGYTQGNLEGQTNHSQINSG